MYVTNNLEKQKLIQKIISQLKRNIIYFKIFNTQRQFLGIVRGVSRDENNQLNLVISLNKDTNKNNLYLFDSGKIEKISLEKKALLVNLSQEESQMLPLYQGSEQSQNHTLPEVKEEKIIPLLEERLVVDRTKRKIGEIVVRKQVETRIVQVPVRYEKLIVEQIGEENTKLAEINLGEGEISGVELNLPLSMDDFAHSVSGEFTNLEAARNLLDAIARQQADGCLYVKIEMMVDDEEKQRIYQQMFDECAD